MSNVIKASPLYSGADQPAVIGKIYEQLFDDSSGNTMVRYLRCFKASGAVTAGSVVGITGSATTHTLLSDMYTTGLAGIAHATANLDKQRLYGVALAAVADGEYGFCVCQGFVSVLAAGATVEGDLLITSGATAGEVLKDAALAAGASNTCIGVALSTQASGAVDAYISVM
jgi:hypothetical protein